MAHIVLQVWSVTPGADILWHSLTARRNWKREDCVSVLVFSLEARWYYWAFIVLTNSLHQKSLKFYESPKLYVGRSFHNITISLVPGIDSYHGYTPQLSQLFLSNFKFTNPFDY